MSLEASASFTEWLKESNWLFKALVLVYSSSLCFFTSASFYLKMANSCFCSRICITKASLCLLYSWSVYWMSRSTLLTSVLSEEWWRGGMFGKITDWSSLRICFCWKSISDWILLIDSSWFYISVLIIFSSSLFSVYKVLFCSCTCLSCSKMWLKRWQRSFIKFLH